MEFPFYAGFLSSAPLGFNCTESNDFANNLNSTFVHFRKQMLFRLILHYQIFQQMVKRSNIIPVIRDCRLDQFLSVIFGHWYPSVSNYSFAAGRTIVNLFIEYLMSSHSIIVGDSFSIIRSPLLRFISFFAIYSPKPLPFFTHCWA